MGILGMWDVCRRYAYIDVFYSLDGMNFRREVTNSFSVKYFTLLDTFQTSFEVHLFFIATFICFFLLMVGFKTKLFHLLGAIGLISIHNAAVILENGGDMVFNNYLIWTLFLPLGGALSIDSLKRSLNQYPENNADDLNKPLPEGNERVFHVAFIACLIQLSMIYYYNYINKTGDMWSDGSAVYYMYQLDTFLTGIGDWVRSYISIGLSTLLTKATLVIEHLAPIFILSPIFQPWLRRMVFIAFMGFHLIIGISVGIGLFSWIMMAVLLLLLSREDLIYLKGLARRETQGSYLVFYDRDCGFCHLTARILKRLDIFRNLTWADGLYENNKPDNLLNLLESTIVVWDEKNNKIYTRHKGFSKIIHSLPFGFIFSWILLIPGLEKAFGWSYDLISRNRTKISTSMGLPACGISSSPEENSAMSGLPAYSSRMVWSKGKLIISNLAVLGLLIGAVDYSLQINEGVSPKEGLKKTEIQPSASDNSIKNFRMYTKRILLYPRMYQQWNMFAPSVIRSEKWVSSQVIFENGEDITLFTSDNKIENGFNRGYFQPFQNQFWRKLFSRINKRNYKKYIPEFRSWLKRTDYFAIYNHRKPKEIQLWQLSERTASPDAKWTPQVRKIELVDEYNRNNPKRSSNRKKQERPKRKL
ncbi:MAG: DCC1-like thiol-disulfide oxidoreductase family protein [Candidatus Marinimicrobia bacterium]|nr:DCC1-like thiol-disulfide oxidoreductase family protein [Candidatus Neomarinimicrobiota bacterium]